jgi:hypothetical protein
LDEFLAASRPQLEEIKMLRMYLPSEINGILTSQRLYLLGRNLTEDLEIGEVEEEQDELERNPRSRKRKSAGNRRVSDEALQGPSGTHQAPETSGTIPNNRAGSKGGRVASSSKKNQSSRGSFKRKPKPKTSTSTTKPSTSVSVAPTRPGRRQYATINFNHPTPATLGDFNTWDEAEREQRRRLIAITCYTDHSTYSVQFTSHVIKSIDVAPPRSRTLSCIYISSRNSPFHQKCIVTSFDMINLICWMIKKPGWFTVDERNRVRRNLEVFKPRTVRKDGPPGTAEVFNQITDFVDPKPHNIMKDFKVFEWKDVEGMMREMANKYEIVLAPGAEVVVGEGDEVHDELEANRILSEEVAREQARLQEREDGVDGDMRAPEESESHSKRRRMVQSQHDASQNLDAPQPGHPCQPAQPFIPVQSQTLMAQTQLGNVQVPNSLSGPHLQQGQTSYHGQGLPPFQPQQPFIPVQSQTLAAQTQLGNLHAPNVLSVMQQPQQGPTYHHGQGPRSYQTQQQPIDTQTQALVAQTQLGNLHGPNLFSGPQPQQGLTYPHGQGPRSYQTQQQPIDTQTQALVAKTQLGNLHRPNPFSGPQPQQGPTYPHGQGQRSYQTQQQSIDVQTQSLMGQTQLGNTQVPKPFSGPQPQQGPTYPHGQGPHSYQTQQQPIDAQTQAFLAQVQLTRLQPSPLSMPQPQQGQNHQFVQGLHPMPSNSRFPELQNSQSFDSGMAQKWLSDAFQNQGPVHASPNQFLTPINAIAQPNMDLLEDHAPFPESSAETLGISQNTALDEDVFLNTWFTEHERSSTALTDGNIVDHDTWIREMLDEALHTPSVIAGGGVSSKGKEVDRSDGNRSDSAETWRDDRQNSPDPPQN